MTQQLGNDYIDKHSPFAKMGYQTLESFSRSIYCLFVDMAGRR